MDNPFVDKAVIFWKNLLIFFKIVETDYSDFSIFCEALACIIETAREFQKNIYFCFIDYPKGFDYVDHNKLWTILKEMGIPDHLACLLRNLYVGEEETELDMEHQTGSKSGNEYIKAVYCHPACLTYMQSTSCTMPG